MQHADVIVFSMYLLKYIIRQFSCMTTRGVLTAAFSSLNPTMQERHCMEPFPVQGVCLSTGGGGGGGCTMKLGKGQQGTPPPPADLGLDKGPPDLGLDRGPPPPTRPGTG